MRRRQLLAAAGLAPLAAHAQPRPELKVGYVQLGPRADTALRVGTLRAGLRLAGAAVGEAEIVQDTTAGDPSRIVPLVTQVLATKPSVFVAAGPELLRAAHRAAANVPIVAYDFETDPVAEGYAQSIARPGGLVTGVFLDLPDFVGKWIEFLRECRPGLQRLALMGDPGAGTTQVESLERIAGKLGLATLRIDMRRREDFAGAMAAVQAGGAEAAVLLSSPLVFVNGRELAQLTLAQRLPTITMFADFARAGGLLAYGADLMGALKQAGTMAGKILGGTNPATLPIERPTIFELVVNLRTAQQLGITVPAALKARADEVVE